MYPFTRNKAESVGALGELRLIEKIRGWLGNATLPAPYGIGDDCAVLPPSKKQQVVTVDPVIYRRHFDDSATPAEVGAKLLKRNLSDLAAMGAMPTAAVLALSIGANLRTTWLEGFYRGLATTSRRYRVPIVGGDIAQAEGALTASLTLIGRAAGKRVVTRSGARIGDWIYVTGRLGGSLLGHHLRFTPRLSEGVWLAAQKDVRALMDVSDGLAKDLYSLIPSGARPQLRPDAIPVSRDAQKLAARDQRPAVDHALSDGEDYELVCAVSGRADRERFESAWARHFRTRLTCIGRFVRIDTPVSAGEVNLGKLHGYEHLR